MKKLLSTILLILMLYINTGCQKSSLDKDDPVTLNMWHVYGEQSYSPMNELIDEFNESEGLEKGVIINVATLSNANDIGNELLASQKSYPNTLDMPDLFFAHPNDAYRLGVENLVDWNTIFSKEELSEYIPEFLEDGIINDKLCVLPTSKSTSLLYIAGEQFDRFSKSTGISYDELSYWDGFFDVAKKYYEYSGGKPFCNFDHFVRNIELYAQAIGEKNSIFIDDNYDFNNKYFKEAFDKFADAIINGYIEVSDLYANTQIMTGEVMCGIESSAAILYFNDNVIYDDGRIEATKLKVLPLPQVRGKNSLMPIKGVGLCAYKTSDQKAEAAKVFAKWFTSKERNFDFVSKTGYMPVTKDSFKKIDNFKFENKEYDNLYKSIKKMKEGSISTSNHFSKEYYKTIGDFNSYLKLNQKNLHKRKNNGEDIENLKLEMWNKFCNK